MDKDIKIYPDLVNGEIKISEHSQYNAIDAEKVIISENVTVRLFGTIKEITLKKGSVVYIHGKVIENVVNEGGEIHIFNHGNNGQL